MPAVEAGLAPIAPGALGPAGQAEELLDAIAMGGELALQPGEIELEELDLLGEDAVILVHVSSG
jgi:hypothetical protein